MGGFYEDANSLFVRAYDAFYAGEPPQIAGDVAFYEQLARETGGPVLELGCGTGRIALGLAERGFDITGIDISDGMLTMARRKAAACPASARDHLTLSNQDMSQLNLGRRFGLAFVPFRSFQHLLTIDQQQQSLEAIRRHLEPTGRLAIHLFDPRLDLLIDANTTLPGPSGSHPETGRRYVGEVLQISFGVDLVDTFRRAATYVDRILRGEKPGNLPVQFPTKFEMIVKLKTAKALGLVVPPSIMLRADEVLECLPVQRFTRVELIINLKTARTLGVSVPLTLLGRADEVIE